MEESSSCNITHKLRHRCLSCEAWRYYFAVVLDEGLSKNISNMCNRRKERLKGPPSTQKLLPFNIPLLLKFTLVVNLF